MRNVVFLGLLGLAALGTARYSESRETPGGTARETHAAHQTLSGTATVTDGDSLEMDGTRIRLNAIDAPEALQTCGRPTAIWKCGEVATKKLRELVGAHPIVCEKTGTDSYGRTVAVCHSGAADLAAEMVSAGLALAYRQYGDEYVDEEAAARSARRGLWKDDFMPPWVWRKNPPAERPFAQRAENPAPRNENRGSCLIKGNINYEGERIYHVPGSHVVRVDEDRPVER